MHKNILEEINTAGSRHLMSASRCVYLFERAVQAFCPFIFHAAACDNPSVKHLSAF